jgi:hypothetical protein
MDGHCLAAHKRAARAAAGATGAISAGGNCRGAGWISRQLVAEFSRAA